LTHRSFSFSLPKEKRPKGDVSRPNTVCVICKFAGDAQELQAAPVGFLNIPASWASFAGISGVHQFKGNAFGGCLVSNEELGGGKWPSIVPIPLLMVLACFLSQIGLAAGIPDTSQVFHNHRPGSDLFCKGHHSLRSEVTRLMRYGFFPSAEPLQEAVGGTGANAGNLCFGLSDTKSLVVEHPARDIKSLVGFGIKSGQDVILSAINPYNGSSGFECWNFDFHGQTKNPLSFDTL
jgi:hypothetical protein